MFHLLPENAAISNEIFSLPFSQHRSIIYRVSSRSRNTFYQERLCDYRARAYCCRSRAAFILELMATLVTTIDHIKKSPINCCSFVKEKEEPRSKVWSVSYLDSSSSSSLSRYFYIVYNGMERTTVSSFWETVKARTYLRTLKSFCHSPEDKTEIFLFTTRSLGTFRAISSPSPLRCLIKR